MFGKKSNQIVEVYWGEGVPTVGVPLPVQRTNPWTTESDAFVLVFVCRK